MIKVGQQRSVITVAIDVVVVELPQTTEVKDGGVSHSWCTCVVGHGYGGLGGIIGGGYG